MNRRRVLLIVAAFVTILGILLVALYVRGANSRAAAQFETVTVLVATQPIQEGESIDEAAANAKLTQARVVRTDVLPNAQTSIEGLSGKVALSEIFPGEQIISDKFGEPTKLAAPKPLEIPKDHAAMSVNLVDADRVAGFLQPGAEVAIYYTPSSLDFTRLLLTPITVLGVGSTAPAPAPTPTAPPSPSATDTAAPNPDESLPRTLLTVAVTQKEASKLTFASKTGILTFVLLDDTGVVKAPAPPIFLSNLFK